MGKNTVKGKRITSRYRRDEKKSTGNNSAGLEINQGWHKVNGEQIEDIEAYIYNYMSEYGHSNVELMIGTDSLVRSKERGLHELKLLSVICFYRPGKGAHVIKRKDNSTYNYFVKTAQKLNAEVQKTYELVRYLDELGLKPKVHLDLNPNKDFESFNVYNTIKGFFESLGYETEYKPDGVAAMACADFYL